MATKAQSNRLDWMDALRGVGALIVVIYHGSRFFDPIRFLGPHVAVDLFFVLSGAILAQVYEPRFARGLSVMGFMGQRLMRLMPVYVIGTSITLVWMLLLKFAQTPNAALNPALVSWQNLLLIPAPGSATPHQALFPLNIPAWTLLAELIVNLVFAFIWRSWRTMLAITVAAFIGLAVAGYIEGHLNVGYTWPTAWVGLLRVLFGFFMGVFLFRLRDRFPRVRSNVWLILLLFLASISIPLAHHRWILDLALIAVFYPVLMILGYQARPSERFAPVWKTLGFISYPLYSLHYGFLVIYAGVGHHVPLIYQSAPWSGFVLLAAAAAASYVVARWDEALRSSQAMRLKRAPSPS